MMCIYLVMAVLSKGLSCAVPTGSPRDILVTSVTSTTVTVTWNPPDFDLQNGAIRYYNVSVMEQKTGNRIWFLETNTEIIVDGLHPYYYYSIRVAMVTIGTGPFSDPVTVHLLESGKK